MSEEEEGEEEEEEEEEEEGAWSVMTNGKPASGTYMYRGATLACGAVHSNTGAPLTHHSEEEEEEEEEEEGALALLYTKFVLVALPLLLPLVLT